MEMLSTLLTLCEGNPPVNGGSPHKVKGPIMHIFDGFILILAYI